MSVFSGVIAAVLADNPDKDHPHGDEEDSLSRSLPAQGLKKLWSKNLEASDVRKSEKFAQGGQQVNNDSFREFLQQSFSNSKTKGLLDHPTPLSGQVGSR